MVKAGSRDSWSGLKRFGKLLYWKKKKGCRGAGLKRVNQGLRLTLRRLNSSAHAEAKHAKRNPKSTTVTTFVWFWLLLLSVCQWCSLSLHYGCIMYSGRSGLTVMYDVTSGNIFPLRNNIAACYSQRGSGHGYSVKTSESTCHKQALKCVLVGVFCCTGIITLLYYCHGLLSPRHNAAHHPHQTDVCYRRDRTVISIYFRHLGTVAADSRRLSLFLPPQPLTSHPRPLPPPIPSAPAQPSAP